MIARDAEYYLLQARIARARGESEAVLYEEAAAKARAERRDHVDQRSSPLGSRRHCAAVKRRVAAGDEGAAIVGRKHLLSREALAAELAALSKRPALAKPEAAGAHAGATPDGLRVRLGLVGGGRR